MTDIQYINQDEIIMNCKKYINDNHFDQLQIYFYNLSQLNINPGTYQYIYQKIFLYTCIIGNETILKWLTDLYFDFDDVSKIALRQMFFYAKYLMKKNKFTKSTLGGCVVEEKDNFILVSKELGIKKMYYQLRK